jgi:hypothetical protein
MSDWTNISALATGWGTLVLAVATFGSVRSANRTARAAEQAHLTNLRPVLLASRMQDPPEKVGFLDSHWTRVPGGHATVEATDDAVYLAIALRNVGNGLAVLHGWAFMPGRHVSDAPMEDPSGFRRLNRDLYVPAGDLGFWQGAFRDPAEPGFADAARAVAERTMITIDLLYGDHEGGQRVVSRFTLTPTDEGPWLATVARHWNLDRAEPRER